MTRKIFIQKFVPERLQGNEIDYGKAQLLVGFIFFEVLMAFVLSPIYLIFQLTPIALAGLLLIVFLILTLFLIRQDMSLDMVGNMITLATFIHISYASYLTGGLTGPGAPLLPIIVLMAILLVGVKSGFFWLAMTSMVIVALYFVRYADLISPLASTNLKGLEVLNIVHLIVIIGVIGFLGAVLKSSSSKNLLRYREEKVKAEKMVVTLNRMFEDGKRIMASMEKGDLTQRMEMDGQIEEIDQLRMTFNKPIEVLNETINRASTAADQVAKSAVALRTSAQQLSEGTSEQAATLEEINSATNELEAQNNQNNENAVNGQKVADQTLDLVNEGNHGMSEMLQSMKKIHTTSSSVAQVIKTIDDIASQTNLLALNAAIEAARAGQYGKGFNVVAEEVRNLAQLSTEAVRETTDLVRSSLKEVEEGVKKSESMSAILSKITESVGISNQLVTEISTASQEQSTAIKEINKGLTQVNNVIQNNAAISAETSSTASALSNHALQLNQLLDQFKGKQDQANFAGAKYKCTVSNLSHPSLKGIHAGFVIRDELWRRTNGQIHFDFKPLSLLGGEVEVMDQMLAGTVQGMAVSSGVSIKLSPRFGLINLPFLVNSFEKVDRFISNKTLLDHFLAGAEHLGVMGLDITSYGDYGWTTTTPIKTLGDIKKIKLRIAIGDIHSSYCRHWGIKTVPIPWTDVSVALKQGVIEGLEQSPTTCSLTQKYEIAKYHTQVNYAQGLFVWIFKKDWFDHLPPDLQNTFKQVVHEVCARMRQESKQQEMDEIAKAKADGVTFLKLSQSDMDLLKQQGHATHEEYKNAINKLNPTDQYKPADYLKEVQDFLGYKPNVG